MLKPPKSGRLLPPLPRLLLRRLPLKLLLRHKRVEY
jgi:hypothetical protein